MMRKQPEQIKAAINRLQDLKVDTVMPAHCSGAPAKEMFQSLYGKQFHAAGVGRLIVLDQGRLTVSTLPVKPDHDSE